MNRDTIRNQVRLAARHFEELDAVLFTTYSFSPDFFEESVLPVVLDAEEGGQAAVRMAVHQRLAETPVSVYYDPAARTGAGGVYRYSAYSVPVKGDCFHPKNIILAGRDKQGNRLVYLSAASANLSLSGWGKNVEAFAATWIHTRKQQPHGALLQFLDWLKGKCHLADEGGRFDALVRVQACLHAMPDRNRFSDAKGAPWSGTQYDRLYFSPVHAKGLADFLWRRRRPKKMTVLAPYWHNVAKELAHFYPWKVELIPTLLMRAPPHSGLQVEEANTATSSVAKTKGELVVSKLSSDDGRRFCHAKVYVLSHEKSSDLAVGSCNFTNAGLCGSGGNVESMLVRHCGPTLDLFTSREIAAEEHFARGEELEEDGPPKVPVIMQVVLDWQSMKYSWRYDHNPLHSKAKLHLPEGLSVQLDRASGELNARKGPRGIATFVVEYSEGDSVHNWTGLITEVNLDLSERTYGSPLRISDILESWKGSHLGQVGTWTRLVARAMDGDEDEDSVSESEGAFHALNLYDVYRAFWDLRQRLKTLADLGNSKAVKSLLVSRPDSVLALLRQAVRAESQEAVRYLVLQEIEDVLRQFDVEHCAAEHLTRLREYAATIRRQLCDDASESGLSGNRLVDWFDHQLRISWGEK